MCTQATVGGGGPRCCVRETFAVFPFGRGTFFMKNCNLFGGRARIRIRAAVRMVYVTLLFNAGKYGFFFVFGDIPM